jgi:hypothetical protein
MFKKKNPTDEALAIALARVDEVLGDRSRIVAAIAKTATDLQATETELEDALNRLAIEEATSALSGDAADTETAAQRTVQSLRLRHEAQQARLRGLDRKVTEHENQVRDANDTLAVAREAWMRARVAEFFAEYRKAADAMAAVLRKGVAIGDALGADSLSAAMREAKLCDPEYLSLNMINMEPVRTHAATGTLERYPVWEDDAAARSVHDGLVDVRIKAEEIRRLADEIRRRRDEAAREEQRRRFESTARPSTVTYESYYPPEYSPITPIEVIEARLGGKQR